MLRAGGRRRVGAGGECAVALQRKEADSPVSRSVGQRAVEHWLRPSSAGGCPSADWTRMKTFPSLCFYNSLDSSILWEEKSEGRKGETAREWRSTKVRKGICFQKHETRLTSANAGFCKPNWHEQSRIYLFREEHFPQETGACCLTLAPFGFNCWSPAGADD